jgi:hypothetical protein
VLATLAGCELPLAEDLIITCKDANECPGGFVCRLEVCQSVDGELDPPAVRSSAITPNLAGRGATVTVNVEANEPLGLLPRLRVVFGDGSERDLVIDQVAGSSTDAADPSDPTAPPRSSSTSPTPSATPPGASRSARSAA